MQILVVDDSTTDRLIIKSMLKDYQVLTASDGLEAMDVLNKNLVDLMILDLNMPNMNGFEVLQRLKEDERFKGVRTIILTNADEIENEIKGLGLGAVDYIRKPLNIESLRIRIDIHLRLKETQNLIEEDNLRLDRIVAKRTRELVVVRNITIQALVGLLEVRNVESSQHTLRTQFVMSMLCNHLRLKPEYRSILTSDYINELVMTTPLHDIGKVGIPDRILLKPGPLDDSEYEIMKKHVDYGVEALKKELLNEVETPSFIKTAMEIIATHHEKYDGSGYPQELQGENIPLSGRLMAIVDVYDALISERVYKQAYSHEQSLQMINSESGKHFDPKIVQAFVEISDIVWETIKKRM